MTALTPCCVCASGGGDPGDGGQRPGLPAGGDKVSVPDQDLPVHLQRQEGGGLPHRRAHPGGTTFMGFLSVIPGNHSICTNIATI